MKAYVLHDISDLRYEDVQIPECPSGWGIVKVKAAGICSSDIPRIMTKGTYHFPTIPGHEFSGIVEAVADEKDQHLVGRRVGIFPLIPCGKCPQCYKGHYEMCSSYDYLGSRRDGGFAEYVSAPVWNMVELPDSVSYIEAAMLEPLSVALHAVKKAGKIQGKTVAVIGTGMIGIAAADWARIRGAEKVWVIGRNEEKRKLVEPFPGITYVNGSDEAYPQSDVVIEAVGTPAAIKEAIASALPGGGIVLMGNPTGDICLPQNIYWQILRKQLCLTGTWNSSYGDESISDWKEAVQILAEKEFDAVSLITHFYDQRHLIDGLELMAQHREACCKVMTVWNEELQI